MKNNFLKYTVILSIALFSKQVVLAQDDLLSIVEKNEPKKKEYVNNAFKSGVLDTRILHRFGLVNSGAKNLYGLDQANMRLGFDYGVSKDLTIGIGRSNVGKELDGFIKYRLIQQSKGGESSSPVSVIFITGMTYSGLPFAEPGNPGNFYSNKMGFYNQVIIGRKFSDKFSFQLTPTHVHLNLVPRIVDANDIFAIGTGARLKLSNRIAFVVDYHYILKEISTDLIGLTDEMESEIKTQVDKYVNPLSIGFDIETGGHVFQLHFSNSTGMNEKSFITNTTNKWGKGEIRFGFNLSRVFTVVKKR
ncbi:MAG: DUF5777 family beta-barrel protein [Sphingobacteriales bacterium]|nr:DUF5777 family beta-barrel protein [Sphingobacteriales bacterium]